MEMEVVKSIGLEMPMILASLLLGIAAAIKLGKERGAVLILLGAISLVCLAVVGPLVWSLLVPRLLADAEYEDHERIILFLRIATGLLWAGAVLLLAIGTFVRAPAPPAR